LKRHQTKFMQYLFHASCKRIRNLAGGEANDSVTLSSQPFIPRSVACEPLRSEMVLPIHLNDQTALVDHEVANISPNRGLPSNMDSIPPTEFPKFGPKLSLSIGHRVA